MSTRDSRTIALGSILYMSRKVGAAASGVRLLFSLVVGGAMAQLMPSVLAGTVDAQSVSVLLAAVAFAAAAVVVLRSHAASSVPRALAVHPGTTADEAPSFRAGRVTDPLHCPLRPRAPGLA